MSELKPCPFCGSDNVMVDETFVDAQNDPYMEYEVICFDCENRTKPCDTAQDAIARWNRRADEVTA